MKQFANLPSIDRLKKYKELIFLSSGTFNIEPEILTALLITESSGYPYAARYEAGFYKRYIDQKPVESLKGFWPKWSIYSESGELKERLDRSTSWGLGQVMGQTAREFGFNGTYLCELCNPEINIPLTSRILSEKIKRVSGFEYQGTELIEAALLKYNGGADKEYPQRVFANLVHARKVLG